MLVGCAALLYPGRLCNLKKNSLTAFTVMHAHSHLWMDWLYFRWYWAAVLKMSASSYRVRVFAWLCREACQWAQHCPLRGPLAVALQPMSHEPHKYTHTHTHTLCYLLAVCSGGVEVWKGSDMETCLQPRCSEATLGWFSPVTPTPAQLDKRKEKGEE